MAQDNKTAQYLHAVSVQLNCPPKTKKNILNMISNDIGSAVEAGLVTPDGIQSHFGNPKDIAEAYLKNLSQGELTKEIRKRKRNIALSIIVSFVVLLAVVYAFLYISDGWRHDKYVFNGNIVDSSI